MSNDFEQEEENESANRQISRSFLGIWIPREVWLIKELSCDERCLWAEIQSLSNNQQKACFASNEYLMAFCKVKERVLQRMLSHLKELSLLVYLGSNGRQRIMRAVLPNEEGCQKMHPRGVKNDTPEVSNLTVSPIYRTKKRTKGREVTPPSPFDSLLTSDNSNNVKDSVNSKYTDYGEYVKLKEGEYEALCKDKGKQIVDYYIEAINNHIPNSKPYKDYAAAIRQWYLRDKKEGKLPNPEKMKGSSATDLTDVIQSNICWFRKIHNKIHAKSVSKNVVIQDSGDYVSFCNYYDSNANSEKIYFKDPKFQELVKHEINKRGLI